LIGVIGTELNGLTETEYMTAILGGVSLSKRTDASYIAIHTPMYRNHTAIIMATDQKAVRLSECFGIMNTHFDGAALLTRSVSLLTAMDTEVTLLQTNGLLAKGSVISVRSSSREVSYGERYSKSFNFSEQFYAVQCTPVIERIGISYVPITVSACVMVFFIIMSTTLWSTIIVRHRLLRRTSVLKGVMDARARAIQLLIAARKDAENANQSKSSFVSYLCHELRNPLHAVRVVASSALADDCISAIDIDHCHA
jgi:signal transduction histidine kinase